MDWHGTCAISLSMATERPGALMGRLKGLFDKKDLRCLAQILAGIIDGNVRLASGKRPWTRTTKARRCQASAMASR